MQPPATEDPFVERLPAEVEAWRSEGLLPAETARVILARYGLVPNESVVTLRRSKIVAVFTVLAAVLIGVGVILVMSSNWEYIPKFGRLAILAIATLALYYFGYRLGFEKRTYPVAGAALVLIGCLVWGASIFLISQMYHLGGGEGREATGLLYWFIGVLPLAYILRSRLQMGLALCVGTVWLILVQSSAFDGPYGQVIFARFLAVGALVYALGLTHDMWKPANAFSGVIKTFGVIYALICTYAMSFRGFWTDGGWHSEYYKQPANGTWFALAGAAMVIALASAIWHVTRPRRDRTAAAEGYATAAVGGVSALALILTAVALFAGQGSHDYTGPSAPPIVFNLVLLALELGVITLGWYRHQPGWINLGLVMFGIQVVTRYFDIFGSLMTGGLFFIGIGVVLLVCGFALEKARRRLVASSSRREEAR